MCGYIPSPRLYIGKLVNKLAVDYLNTLRTVHYAHILV